jgi:DNA-binding response OmpR family regulator
VLTSGDLHLDPARRVVTRGGRELELARKEFGVLHALMAAAGDVVTTEDLLASVWDANVDPFSNIVRMTVMKLRRKLGEPKLIETVPGMGYRM